MRIRDEIEIDIWFPDQISGLPMDLRSAIRRVAILLATTEGQRGNEASPVGVESEFQGLVEELSCR